MELDQAHRLSQEIFGTVLESLNEGDLSRESNCDGWSINDLVEHVIGGNYRVAGQVEEFSNTESIFERFQSSANEAIQTFEVPDGLKRMYKLPMGEIPGSIFVGLRATDLFAHSWDLCHSLRIDEELDYELAQTLYDFAKPRINPMMRGDGKPFGLETLAEHGSSITLKLMAFLGRNTSRR